jgi:hypothetical protein
MSTTTTNMNLTVPTVSETTGPEYANEVNEDLEVIDAHDHSDGKGVPVPTAGIDIDADLPLNGFNATEVRSVRLEQQVAPLAEGTDRNCFASVEGDLYWNNENGTPVKVTNGDALNASAVGGFTGLAGTTGAATYASGPGTFTFTSNTNEKAGVKTGPLTVHDTAAGANGITVKSPTALAAPYDVTLPGALPGATKFMRMEADGDVTVDTDVDNSTLEVSGTTVRVKAGGSTKPKLAALGQQLSSNSNSFSGTSTTWANITDLVVTLTSTGRPIMLLCIAGSSNAKWGISRVAVGAGTTFGELRIAVSGDATANIAVTRFGGHTAGSTTDLYYPPSIYSHIYVPAAGTYTFQIQYQVNGGSGDTLYATDMQLVAYEL